MTVFEPAVPYTVLPVSDVERQAIDELMPKLDTTGCEARAAQLKARARPMFDKTIEPTEVPEFVARKNADEQERLQSQIDSLRERVS